MTEIVCSNGSISFSKMFLILLFPALLISFILLILIFLFFYLSNDFSSRHPSPPLNHYQYTEIHSNNRISTYGSITSDVELSDEEFLSYINEDTGNTILISQLGGVEYECTGFCTCNTKSPALPSTTPEDRRLATTVSHSLKVVILALSSAMAIEMAQRIFRQQECYDLDQEETTYEDECDDMEDVHKFVEACEEPIRMQKDDTLENFGFREYACYGYCVTLDEDLWDTYDDIVEIFDTGYEGTCREQDFEMELLVDFSKEVKEGSYHSLSGKEKQERAVDVFRRNFLQGFCSEFSRVEVPVEIVENGKKMEVMRETVFCSALDVLEQNVQCYPIAEADKIVKVEFDERVDEGTYLSMKKKKKKNEEWVPNSEMSEFSDGLPEVTPSEVVEDGK